MVPHWWAHPWAGGGWWGGAARALTGRSALGAAGRCHRHSLSNHLNLLQ